jgi:hypothetical protein
MNIIKVKDFDSMQAITVGLARNGYMVTADSVTDENYKEHWEIKYCEFSEMNKIPVNNGSDWDGDHISSMEIHNKANTKGVKCKILPDENQPLVENEKDKVDPNSVEIIPKYNEPDIPVIPNRDTSDIITDDQMTNITSVSGN